MAKEQPDLPHVDPDEMDYGSMDLYDLGEDLRHKECAELYEKYTDLENRYIDVVEIASGGMKTIYRTLDNKTNREIALARLNEGLGEEFVASFINEARLTASLQHPNIIKVHEIGFDKEQKPYFTMELKPGDSLREILKKLHGKDQHYLNKYSLKERIIIFLKVCDAISYSHSFDILHLDIKPENVQVGDFGEVLLCDWGLSRYIGDSLPDENDILHQDFLVDKTMHSKIKGTPGYMAPEQITREEEKEIVTDIYALGGLLYSLLTFERPIDGKVEDILDDTVKGNMVPPSTRTPELDIPEGLNAVILKAMTVNMADRYASVKDLANDVSQFMDGFSTSAENAGFWKEFSLFYKRNYIVVNLSCFFMVIILLGVSFFIHNLNQSMEREVDLREKAEISEQMAKENLAKYKSEKALADKSLSYSPEGVVQELEYKLKKYIHIDTKNHVDRIHDSLLRISEANKSDPFLYQTKAIVHFIRQEFDLCHKELVKGEGIDAHQNNTYLDMALSYLGNYKSKEEPAPVNILTELIKDLDGNMIKNLYRLMLYDAEYRQDFSEHLEIVKAIFYTQNRAWLNSEFIYDPDKKSLKVKGDFRSYNLRLPIPDIHVSIFHTLDIKHLKIQTPNKLLAKNIRGIKLDSLDVRGMQFLFNLQKLDPEVAQKIYLTRSLVKAHLVPYFEENFEVVWE